MGSTSLQRCYSLAERRSVLTNFTPLCKDRALPRSNPCPGFCPRSNNGAGKQYKKTQLAYYHMLHVHKDLEFEHFPDTQASDETHRSLSHARFLWHSPADDAAICWSLPACEEWSMSKHDELSTKMDVYMIGRLKVDTVFLAKTNNRGVFEQERDIHVMEQTGLKAAATHFNQP